MRLSAVGRLARTEIEVDEIAAAQAAVSHDHSEAIKRPGGCPGHFLAKKVVLFGNAVFDNGAYVSGGSDVLEQLVRRVPGGWSAMLLASDGTGWRCAPATPAPASGYEPPCGKHWRQRCTRRVRCVECTDLSEALHRIAAIRECLCFNYLSTLDVILAAKLPTAIRTLTSTVS